MPIEVAEKILVDLFNQKILQMVVRVECMNEDNPHYVKFNSLKEYYKASEDEECPECGASLDWKKAKVAFKRGIYR
ncbi:hypothetical protein V8V55_14870 [Priestia megaterium]|uniref:hypothetical protein n=1 Tax=Priestia megaterium TaxID=1404 RepID=UPI00300B85C4